MSSFEVYGLVLIYQVPLEAQRQAMPTRWVDTWKGDKVACRLVAKDLAVKLYATTRAFITLADGAYGA